MADNVFAPLAKSAFPIIIDKGEGSYLYDIEGKKYIDLATGIAVNPLGHCHPAVTHAIKTQVDKLMSSTAIFNTEVKLNCAQEILDIMPENMESLFFCNSGTEAVEGALKLAKKLRPERPYFLAFNKGFHGRTLGALQVTHSKSAYRQEFCKETNCYSVDYPSTESELQETLSQIEKLFTYSCTPEQIAAIIVEPVIGEGGYIVPPDNFLPTLRAICDKYNILLICDEVQTGFGRTGKWFGCEHSNTQPDIITFAKGVASGMPLGGFASTRDNMQKLVSGTHGSTFGGNPLSCAAALATISTIKEECLIEQSSILGKKILERFDQKFGQYLDIRGKGFMIGIEPKPGVNINIKNITQRLFNKGLITLSCGTDGQVLRLMPPLNISESVLNSALSILEQVLDYELLVFNECERLNQEHVPATAATQ